MLNCFVFSSPPLPRQGDQTQAVSLRQQETLAQQQQPGNGVELGRCQVSRQ